MNEEDDFLSNCEHADEDLIAEDKKRQKEAKDAEEKIKKEAEEAKKKIIPLEVIEFRKMAIPFLNKFEIVNKKDVGFLKEEYSINNIQVESYLKYFNERFKITHDHLETEKQKILSSIQEIKIPDTFQLSKILNRQNIILSICGLFLFTTCVTFLQIPSFITIILFISICLMFGFFLFQHYKAVQHFNVTKDNAIQAYNNFLVEIQKIKEKELVNMYETKYMPSLAFDKKVIVKKLDMDFVHLKDKVINIPRLVYETLKNDNKYWNQFLIDRVLKVFNYNDNMRIEDYLKTSYDNSSTSKYHLVCNLIDNLEKKKERFYFALQTMTDEEFKKFLNAQQDS